MDGLEDFGVVGEDDEVGFDFGAFAQAAGGVINYGVSTAETEKKAKEAKATAQKNAAAVIAADLAAANAIAKADVSTQTAAPSAAIDAAAAQRAIDAQDRAGAAGLSEEAAKNRAEAADRMLDAAIKAAQLAPSDKNKAALVKAWTTVTNKAHSTAIVANAANGLAGFGVEQQSWFTRPVMGAVPGYGVLALGAAALGIVTVVLKKFVFAKAGG